MARRRRATVGSPFIPTSIHVLFDDFAASSAVSEQLASRYIADGNENQCEILDRLLDALPETGDGALKRLKDAIENLLSDAARFAHISTELATQVIEKDYQADVDNVASELAARIEEGEVRDVSDALHEAVGGTQRVIYNHEALAGLLASRNDRAIEEAVADAGEGEVPEWSTMMYHTMRQDVVERLEQMGYDLNDPQPLEEDDDDEDQDQDQDEEEDGEED